MASGATSRPPRLRIPNTRMGAALVAGAIAAAGFALGVGFLVVVPLLRSGSAAQPPTNADRRTRILAPRLPTPLPGRPELWLTPVATLAFPSPEQVVELRGAKGSVSVSYLPGKTQPVLPLPPISDALGRPRVSAFVVFTSNDDPRTPGPLRPQAGEPTQLVIAATVALSNGVVGCVLAFDGPDLTALAGLGGAPIDDCRSGTIRIEEVGALAFAVSLDELPNYRALDGSWRPGGVFARTDVRIALRAAPAA